MSSLEFAAARANRSLLKRALDIVGSLAGLIVLGPFLFVVAILIRCETRGPAIFRQRRTGRGGKVFQIYKFRTMTVLEDGDQVVQARAGDPRITTLGGFLRRSCIDELPQLLNVLKGEMSLVGPRPHAVAHDHFYGQLIPGYDDRFLVRPGIGGLAQVSGHRGPTETVDRMAQRIALDRTYIEGWCITADVRLLLKSIVDSAFDSGAM